MSYSPPAPYGPLASARRPGVVTAAAYLMILVAALEIVSVILALATMNTLVNATDRAYAGTASHDAALASTRIGVIIGVLIGLLIAAGFIVLALLDLRGKNGARIVTWVLSGLGVLCLGCGAVLGAAAGGLTSMQGRSANGVDVGAASRQIQDALPAWYRPTSRRSP